MFIFLAIALSVYGLINFYIVRRGLSVVPPEYHTLFIVASVFIVLSYIAGRFLERAFPSFLSTILIWVGSFWIAFMFYFFLALIVLDFLRLVNHIIPYFPPVFSRNPERTKLWTALVIVVIVSITVIGGFINTKSIVIKNYKIYVKKNAGSLKSLNIVIASDIHLGTILGKSFIEKVAGEINALKPDIVLFPGDIIDEDIGPVLRNGVGEVFSQINSRYGIYAVTGNHEYIGGVTAACEYMTGHGIRMLRDTAVKIDDSFYLIGREDRSAGSRSKYPRKPLKEVLDGVDKSFPLIMMDHQPFGLNEASDNQIDLQISGHTHNGQLWPLNFVISRIYELGWGYAVKGKTHYYVSCGVGGWGPPVRTGSRPEIIDIKIVFNGNQQAGPGK
jgi:predicted MPP superfamily phosphohydrolase